MDSSKKRLREVYVVVRPRLFRSWHGSSSISPTETWTVAIWEDVTYGKAKFGVRAHLLYTRRDPYFGKNGFYRVARVDFVKGVYVPVEVPELQNSLRKARERAHRLVDILYGALNLPEPSTRKIRGIVTIVFRAKQPRIRRRKKRLK